MRKVLVILIFLILSTIVCAGGNGNISHEIKISDLEGLFNGTLGNSDKFGSAVTKIGDLDADGVNDIVVGHRFDDEGGSQRGAVWVLFLNSNGTVKSNQKIASNSGNFSGSVSNGDNFGTSVADIGDLNGDGITDLVVGAPGTDDGDGNNRGAVWILFMNTNGQVKSHQKISNTFGNFSGPSGAGDKFGTSVSNIGDLDNDGNMDIAVGAHYDDDGVDNRGAVWILFLNNSGGVKHDQKISDTKGLFNGTLDDSDFFGVSVTNMSDLDNDGVEDIAVGAFYDDDGGNNRGAVWILFLNTNGTVKSNQKISNTRGNFSGDLDNSDYFGRSVDNIGDLDGDGIIDLAVSARGDDDGGTDRGAVWILFMNNDGNVKSHQKISDTSGNFSGTIGNSNLFGVSVTDIGDLDGDGVQELSVGHMEDDDGGIDRGAVWILFMQKTAGSGGGSAVPEFSDYVMVLLLLTVVGGFFLIRRDG